LGRFRPPFGRIGDTWVRKNPLNWFGEGNPFLFWEGPNFQGKELKEEGFNNKGSRIGKASSSQLKKDCSLAGGKKGFGLLIGWPLLRFRGGHNPSKGGLSHGCFQGFWGGQRRGSLFGDLASFPEDIKVLPLVRFLGV